MVDLSLFRISITALVICLVAFLYGVPSGAEPPSPNRISKSELNSRLLRAADKRDKSLIIALLKQGADVEAHDKDGFTALMLATRVWGKEDTIREVVRILREHGANVNATDSAGQTALMRAANDFNSVGVRVLLDNGADPNATDIYGWTPLMHDVGWQEYDMHYGGREKNHIEIAHLLVARGANLNQTDHRGMTALMIALWFSQSTLAKALLDLGADTTIRDRLGRTAMTLDAGHNRPITIDLLQHGAHIGAIDAILMRDEPLALAHLKREPNPKEHGVYEETALMAAAERGASSVVHRLLEQGANPNETEPDGLTALILALGGRPRHSRGAPPMSENPDSSIRIEIVRDLLKAGASINARIKFTDREVRIVTPLQWAIGISPTEMVQLLLESGADVNLPADKGVTPLMVALEAKYQDNYDYSYLPVRRPNIAQLLIERGADVNAEDAEGNTALMRCTDDRALMQQLFEHGANLKQRNHRGKTLLSVAAENRSNTLDWLLAQGLDLHEQDHFGWTLLTYAAHYHDQKAVAKLKSKGIKVTLVDAIFLNDVAQVKRLLDKGENPNHPEPDGQSLLKYAVDARNPQIVALLLKHGADVNFKLRDGVSALSYAEILNDETIITMLKRAGAKH